VRRRRARELVLCLARREAGSGRARVTARPPTEHRRRRAAPASAPAEPERLPRRSGAPRLDRRLPARRRRGSRGAARARVPTRARGEAPSPPRGEPRARARSRRDRNCGSSRARAAASCRSRLLPLPGSPTIRTAATLPAAAVSAAAASAASSSALPTNTPMCKSVRLKRVELREILTRSLLSPASLYYSLARSAGCFCCKHSASIALPQRCHRVPPKCTAMAQIWVAACISAEYGGTRIHNRGGS
jgi:hypothetical protein